MNILAVRKFLTATPFDVNTEQGRTDERYRLAIWATLANTLSTGLAMVALLITVPMTLPYLGEERFGVWMTVSSIAALLSFLDFGIGNGLINRVAQANASSDKKDLAFVVTHGLVLLSILGVLVGIVFFPLIKYLPWETIIKVKNPANIVEIQYALVAFLLIFAASIPLNAIQKIFQGMQIAWQAHLIRGLGYIVSLIVVYTLAEQQAGVPELLLATFGIQTAFPLFLLVLLVRKNVIQLNTLKHSGLMVETSALLQSGGLFFLLQIGGLLVWSIDSFIIAGTLGAASVTKFALVQRLFQFILIPLAIVNAPLWGAYADAHASGDKLFIAKTLKKSMIFTMVGALLSAVLISSLAPQIFYLWIHNASDVPSILVWSYGLLVFFMATGNSLAMFLNGVGEIKSQVFTVGLFCLFAVPLKYFGIIRFGIEGLIWASITAYILTVLLPYLTIFRNRLNQHLI